MIIRDQDPVRWNGAHNRHAARRWITWAVLLVVLILYSPTLLWSTTTQSPLVLKGPSDMGLLSKHIEYIIDPTWQLRAPDFKGTSKLTTAPLPSTVPDFGYTAAKIWLTLPVINGTVAQDEWNFSIHANFMQQVALYKLSADGTIETLLDLNEDSPFDARPVDYPQLVAPFQLAPNEAATLVLAYYSQGSSRQSMSIETPASFAKLASVAQAKSYGFYGMMLVMFALVSAALVVLRQAVFAAFAGYLISMFLFVSHSDGVAFQHIWSEFPRFNTMASVVAGSGVMIFGGLFAMTILQTARYHPIMHRVLITVIASILLIDVVLWSTNPQLLKRFLVIMLSVSTLTYLMSGLVAARTRLREVRFYVFAWIAVFIPASLFTARNVFGFEASFLTLYDTIRIALVFEALLMGLAIFDRYNQMRQYAVEENLSQVQTSLALTQRLAALEGNYALVSDNFRRQEESVKDTVHDLRQPMQALRLSLRQLINPLAGNATDATQVDAALAYMERLVAERLVDHKLLPDNEHHAHGGRAPNDEPTSKVLHETEPCIQEVLRGIYDMFSAEAAAKGLTLRLVFAAPDTSVAGYPLMRVVANLVSNAIKYTKQGRIVIAHRCNQNGHFVEVHDTGPGLKGAEFEQALLRNERLDRDRDAAEGSGLGLSMVKEIVDANGWAISSCDHRTTGASLRVMLQKGT